MKVQTESFTPFSQLLPMAGFCKKQSCKSRLMVNHQKIVILTDCDNLEILQIFSTNPETSFFGVSSSYKCGKFKILPKVSNCDFVFRILAKDNRMELIS